MNLDLTGKRALVCGASQGLGAAVARELALLGASVILSARNEEKLKTALGTLDQSRGQLHGYIAADASEPENLDEKIAVFLAGGKNIEILVNNTGGPSTGPLIDTRVADLESAFRAHLITAHLLTRRLVPGMKSSGFGRIVNIVSTSVKQPIPGLGISNTVRAAVANWAKTLAGELGGFGITVNNVLPGSIKTARLDGIFKSQATESRSSVDEIIQKSIALIPVGRLGEPAEFAAAVAFLCTPAASYINGISLPVDGGKTLGL
jgi:3-oxoacyl-[acyl-carrier protein] reductase